jgi:hypothetical protein
MDDTRVNIDRKIEGAKKLSKLGSILKLFVYNPFLAGISGFTLFFLFAIFLDFMVNLFVPDTFLTIDIYTVLIGFAGFILAFGFSFLESTQK